MTARMSGHTTTYRMKRGSSIQPYNLLVVSQGYPIHLERVYRQSHYLTQIVIISLYIAKIVEWSI